MLDFKINYDKNLEEYYLETSLSGKALLTIPQLNKGTAFTEKERHDFGLRGKLPARIETLDEQVMRAYAQYLQYDTKMRRNIYLNVLHNTNQTVFYALVKHHLAEMVPLIYTPIVGSRIQEFSREFRQARGLYITYEDTHNIEEILENRSNPEIDLIVVTDGERVLGLGDQGVGAMAIPVAKLMIYSICGAIDPNRTLPILLDVGTNNQELLDDPLYLGMRHKRLSGKVYDDFIHAFISAVKKKLPQALLHWEDFGRENAHRNLNTYREKICSFNDDIQGTGVVTLAALLSAVKKLNSHLRDHRIVVFGAGSAGTGISDQIRAAMRKAGIKNEDTYKHFWLVDKPGLITEHLSNLTPEQTPYARKTNEIANWKIANPASITFAEVIENVKPTILIGCSAAGGAFTKEIVQAMATYVEHPIIFPLSNPTEKAEAQPEDLINWTENKALIATGSPFEKVNHQGQLIEIAQCNNSFAFPGISLGTISVRAKKVSDDMLLAAAMALSECIATEIHAPLLPSIDEVEHVAKCVGMGVAKQAIKEGLSSASLENVENLIDAYRWEPHYLPYKFKPSSN